MAVLGFRKINNLNKFDLIVTDILLALYEQRA